MTDIIARESQKLQQDADVVLFEIDARKFGGGVLRFTAGTFNGDPLVFNGYAYTPMPLEAGGFKWDGQGTAPRPTLTLSALNTSLMALIRDHGDLVGAPVKRIRTYAKCLDNGSDPDPEATFPIDEYVVERKSKQNSLAVEIELSVQSDQEGRMVPGRQVLRDVCPNVYRRWDGDRFNYEGVNCPYAGDACFDRSGNPVAAPEQDDCGHRLSDCERRYPNQPLPFGGFPGVGRY